MDSKRWFALGMVLTGLILLMVLAVRASPPAQGPEPQGIVAGQAGVGTAKTEAGDGETVTVIISGVSDVHSGLVPGEMYYLQGDGSLGLTPTMHRVGRAISKSELILDQIW